MPGLVLNKPGHDARGQHLAVHSGLWLWVPAFAGRRDTRSHPRGACRPSFAWSLTLRAIGGRREDRVAACTRGARANNCAKSAFTTGTGGISPAFPAQWFTAYGALSPVNLADCHRHRRDATHHHQLSAEPLGRQDHTILPSASVPLVNRHVRVHRNPPHVRDDAYAPRVGVE